jgi:hypothetical protein
MRGLCRSIPRLLPTFELHLVNVVVLRVGVWFTSKQRWDGQMSVASRVSLTCNTICSVRNQDCGLARKQLATWTNPHIHVTDDMSSVHNSL